MSDKTNTDELIRSTEKGGGAVKFAAATRAISGRPEPRLERDAPAAHEPNDS